MFFDYVPDPGDGLREWADGIDVRTGKATTRRLVHTAVGRRILGERQGAPQIRAALRWIFNQAPVPANGPDEDFGAPPWEDESPPEDSALLDIGPEPDDPFVRPGEMTVHSRPVRAVLRQLADDGRAYGAPREAVVELREHAGVLYQREYRKCGKRNPKTGQPWCWCFGAWPNGGHGPYWYAYWRDDATGRRRTTYIGKVLRLLSS